MKKILYIISFIVLLFSRSELKSQSEFPIIEKLYEISNTVVQGQIMRIDCVLDNIGSAACSYSIRVDSVFKGKPEMYRDHLIEYSQPGSAPLTTSIDDMINIIQFNKSCHFFLDTSSTPITHTKDNCFEVGDMLIFFLKEVNKKPEKDIPSKYETRYSYDLVDQWAGALHASSYLAIYLRSLAIKN